MVLGSAGSWLTAYKKPFISALPNVSSPLPMQLEPTATTRSPRASGAQTVSSAGRTGADTSMVTENRFSPVFSARTGSWQLAASLLRFWTAASLSTRISSVSGVCSSARAFFAITTGMGHCLPSASTTTDMEHNSFNSDFQVQCSTIHRDSQEKTTRYGKTPAETSAGANSVRRSQGYAPFGRPPHL